MSLLLAFTMLALAIPAPNDDLWDSKEIRDVQAKFGNCVVRQSYTEARKLVLNPNLSGGEFRRAMGWSLSKDCLLKAANARYRTLMTFPLDTMRYVLADALVRREYSVGSTPAIKEAAPLERPKFDQGDYQPKPGKVLKREELERLKIERDGQIGIVFLAVFGECVVRANPEKSHALLKTNPVTAEENAAFAALTPMFSQCLPAGQQLAFGKPTLRGTIAMNFYRLANAPRVTSAPAGASK